jgi:hypothetical protein
MGHFPGGSLVITLIEQGINSISIRNQQIRGFQAEEVKIKDDAGGFQI